MCPQKPKDIVSKIDIHCHTTDRLLRHTVDPDASLDTIESKMEEFGIEKTVLLATYFPRKGTGISNFRLLRWIENNPKFVMFGSFDFGNFYQGLNELNELLEEGLIKGVKVYLGYQNFDGTKLLQILKLCQLHGAPIMFHTGNCVGLGYDVSIPYEIEAAISCYPEVSFIFSHLSNPNVKEVVELCSRYPNAYSDMSGLISSKKDQDYIPTAIELTKTFYRFCGAKKLLFGTDFPVQTHSDSILILEQAVQNKEDLRDIYYNNAKRLLKL
jgi:predicted TIM-barrel fold metal-dependent hydrolase